MIISQLRSDYMKVTSQQFQLIKEKEVSLMSNIWEISQEIMDLEQYTEWIEQKSTQI